MVTPPPLDFEQLHAAHGERMQAIARRITRNPWDAEEAAQEAWLKVWRTRANFDGRSVGGWLTTAAQTSALDKLRLDERKHAIPWGPFVDVLAGVLPARDNTEREALEGEWRERVRAAVETLAPQQRRALLLVTQERTMAEGAAAMGVTIGAFKCAVFRARAAMRQRLGREA